MGLLETFASDQHLVDGGIVVSAGEILRLEYSDPSPLDALFATTEVQTSSRGVMSIDLQRVQAGAEIIIRVEDDDLNASPDSIEHASVTARSSIAAGQIEYTLAETGVSTGAFTGSIYAEMWKQCSEFGLDCKKDVQSVGFDSNIYVLEGGSLMFTYTDAAPFNASTITVPVCTTASMTVHTLLISIGQIISIEVYDVDQAGNGTVSVIIFANGTDQAGETFVLTEQNSGLFMTSLETTHDANPGPGFVTMFDNTRVHFVYEDECPSVDIMVEARAYILSTLAFSLSEAKVGELVTVTVEDRQRKTESSLTILCFGSDGDEQEVELVQAPFESGFFIGVISPGNPGNVSAVPG
eukprot:1205074-Rhodomonas_salina.1